jgi:hypothetical protein
VSYQAQAMLYNMVVITVTSLLCAAAATRSRRNQRKGARRLAARPEPGHQRSWGVFVRW